MRAVFADTFYWVALTNPADPYYRNVMARQDEIADASILTTDAVLSEFLTFFAGDKRLRDRVDRCLHGRQATRVRECRGREEQDA